MPRYFVQVTQAEKVAARLIDQSVGSIGSHFATHADWHRKDGVCVGTTVIEAADHRRALGIVPPGMRAAANLFHLASITVGVGIAAVPRLADRPYALAA